MQNKFICFEGIEGSGKSTSIELVKQIFTEQGIKFIFTREPGGTVLAEELREIVLHKEYQELICPEAELLLVFAARAQHLKEVIIPALNAGYSVLCDRFTASSYAYQGAGRGIQTECIAWLECFVQKDLRPDLNLIFDLDLNLSQARLRARGLALDKMETQNLEFFARVKQAYLDLALKQPKNYLVIDAALSLEALELKLREIFALCKS